MARGVHTLVERCLSSCSWAIVISPLYGSPCWSNSPGAGVALWAGGRCRRCSCCCRSTSSVCGWWVNRWHVSVHVTRSGTLTIGVPCTTHRHALLERRVKLCHLCRNGLLELSCEPLRLVPRGGRLLRLLNGSQHLALAVGHLALQLLLDALALHLLAAQVLNAKLQFLVVVQLLASVAGRASTVRVRGGQRTGVPPARHTQPIHAPLG